MNINIHKYFFPVFAGDITERFTPINLFGTATHIGGGYFITAGHTLQNSHEYDDVRIGILIGKDLHFVNIDEYEIFEDLDLGIFNLLENPGPFKTLKVSFERLDMLENVICAGFPHGLDSELGVLRNRALKGYIVNHGPLYQFRKRPSSYELSFQCPKGISGAPIMKFHQNKNEYFIHGYVVGNFNTEITVFSEREVSSDGESTNFYEKTESTKFGIAINIVELKNINSRLLGNMQQHLELVGSLE